MGRSILSKNPEIKKEWHSTKNGQLDPKEISYGSNQILWWTCPKGHEYEMSAKKRSIGRGCPVCAGKKIVEGVNDLAAVHPAIAQEWHPARNNPVLPTEVFPGSSKRFWWRCSMGHEWQTSAANRVRGTGCPYCCGKRPFSSETDFATTHPEIAKQWDYSMNGELKPEMVSSDSSRKVWWRCSIPSHPSWRTAVHLRLKVKGGSKCPVCANRKILSGVNDLKTLRPDLAAEWHPSRNEAVTPRHVGVGTNKRVWWKCRDGHEWKAKIANLCEGHGCPFCAGVKMSVGQTDLLTLRPEVAADWHPSKNGDKKPESYAQSSGAVVWWKCNEGHEYRRTIRNQARSKGCPFCRGRKLLEGFNDLATTHPELSSEWDLKKNAPLIPTEVTRKTIKKVWWMCPLGHSYAAMVSNRILSGTGCPYCAHKRILRGFNDLATKNPELAREWHPKKNGKLRPCDVFPASSTKRWWRCACGHEWESTIGNRSKGQGCPKCARRRKR